VPHPRDIRKPPRHTEEQRQWVLDRIRAVAVRLGVPVESLTRDTFLEQERDNRVGCRRIDIRDHGGWSSVRSALFDEIEIDLSDLDVKGERLLVIPDVHAHPGVDNARLTWAGRWIATEQPEHVVCLGDFWDMPSLSSYDKGKRSAENRRARLDIEAGVSAMDSLVEPWKGWQPKSMTFIVGNHEERLDRIGHDEPALEGVLGVESLGIERWGWDVVPFKETASVCGFTVSHFLPSGVMGRPIGGMNPAATILRLHHESAIVGHLHTYDFKTLCTASGQRLMAIVAGCLTHPEDYAGWNRNTHRMWCRCLTMISNLEDGFGDLRQIGLTELASA